MFFQYNIKYKKKVCMFRVNKHLLMFFSFIFLFCKQHCSEPSQPHSLATTPEARFNRETPGLNIPPLHLHGVSSCAASSKGSRSHTPDTRVAHGKENSLNAVNVERRQCSKCGKTSMYDGT